MMTIRLSSSFSIRQSLSFALLYLWDSNFKLVDDISMRINEIDLINWNEYSSLLSLSSLFFSSFLTDEWLKYFTIFLYLFLAASDHHMCVCVYTAIWARAQARLIAVIRVFVRLRFRGPKWYHTLTIYKSKDNTKKRYIYVCMSLSQDGEDTMSMFNGIVVSLTLHIDS